MLYERSRVQTRLSNVVIELSCPRNLGSKKKKLILIIKNNNFLTRSTEKTSGNDRFNKFHTTYSRCTMTPTTRPKSQKPSTVLCYIYVAAVTVFLVVFVLECPLCNPTRVTFPFIFENRVLGILKPSFHMDHQVDIRLYLTEATTLHHYKEPISLKSSSCTCNPNSLLTSNTLRSISFHFNEPRPSILH